MLILKDIKKITWKFFRPIPINCVLCNSINEVYKVTLEKSGKTVTTTICLKCLLERFKELQAFFGEKISKSHRTGFNKWP
jgi:hypothetical protein